MLRLLERARERRERRVSKQEIPEIQIPEEFRRIEVYPPRIERSSSRTRRQVRRPHQSSTGKVRTY